MNLRAKFQTATSLLSFCHNHAKISNVFSFCTQRLFQYSNNSSQYCKNSNEYLKTYLTQTRSTVLPGIRSYNFYQNVSSYHTLLNSSDVLNTSLKSNEYLTCSVRCKSKKKRYDSDTDSDSEADDNLDEDDFEAPTQFKVQNTHTPSLRIDAILSKALGLSRHRLEEIFFGPGILMNGKKVLKKGGKMDTGDYVDVILEKIEDQIRVKRVKLLKVGSEKTATDKFIIKVRVWKAPFLIANPDQWKHGS